MFTNILKNNPYPTQVHGETLCKVEKKGPLYAIGVTGGGRILYDIIGQNVLIHCSGNHDKQIRYLRKFKK